MASIILLNKPYQVLSQFTDGSGRSTLKQLLPDFSGYYPAGRLDYDSEGLLLLTDDGALQHRISDPRHKQPKTYWVQVEGQPDNQALNALRNGVSLNDGPTRPAHVRQMDEPQSLWPRNPPIRERQTIPTHWLEITIAEGRNRQVRRMTAAVNLPTLRLIRACIGPWKLGELLPGEYRLQEVYVQQAPSGRNASLSKPHRQPGSRRKR